MCQYFLSTLASWTLAKAVTLRQYLKLSCHLCRNFFSNRLNKVLKQLCIVQLHRVLNKNLVDSFKIVNKFEHRVELTIMQWLSDFGPRAWILSNLTCKKNRNNSYHIYILDPIKLFVNKIPKVQFKILFAHKISPKYHARKLRSFESTPMSKYFPRGVLAVRANTSTMVTATGYRK